MVFNSQKKYQTFNCDKLTSLDIQIRVFYVKKLFYGIQK